MYRIAGLLRLQVGRSELLNGLLASRCRRSCFLFRLGRDAAAYVRALMPRLARRAGIEKRVHAHGPRRRTRPKLAMEGKPVNLIRAQLGHSSLAVTSTYLAHIAPAQLIEAMRSRPAFSV